MNFYCITRIAMPRSFVLLVAYFSVFGLTSGQRGFFGHTNPVVSPIRPDTEIKVPDETLKNEEKKLSYWLAKSSSSLLAEIDDDNAKAFLNKKPENIIFIIPDSPGNKSADSCRTIGNAILMKKKKSDVIIVDWQQGGNKYNVVQNTKNIGRIFADFISRINGGHLKPKHMIFIGHGIGAHVAGFAGKFLTFRNETISRIIGLDPTKETFEYQSCERRLCKSDAKFTKIIHTNGADIGISGNIGNADFYPNNGMKQPGCFTNECSHDRSWQYFAEGILKSDHFKARKCDNYETFINNKKSCSSTTTHMCSLDSKKEGTFYLNTHAMPPYSRS